MSNKINASTMAPSLPDYYYYHPYYSYYHILGLKPNKQTTDWPDDKTQPWREKEKYSTVKLHLLPERLEWGVGEGGRRSGEMWVKTVKGRA